MLNLITEIISTRLKIARKANGYSSTKEFVEKNSIASTTYWQHESGKRALSIENLFNYSEILNIDPSWLLTGNGNPCGEYGDKKIEQNILEQQEALGRQGKLIAKAIPSISLENQYSNINIGIFKKILQELIPLLNNVPPSKTDEVINFSFDLYNRIVTTDVDDKERVKLIQICIESFFSGLGIRLADETLANFSSIG